jgi:hypothetical protein
LPPRGGPTSVTIFSANAQCQVRQPHTMDNIMRLLSTQAQAVSTDSKDSVEVTLTLTFGPDCYTTTLTDLRLILDSIPSILEDIEREREAARVELDSLGYVLTTPSERRACFLEATAAAMYQQTGLIDVERETELQKARADFEQHMHIPYTGMHMGASQTQRRIESLEAHTRPQRNGHSLLHVGCNVQLLRGLHGAGGLGPSFYSIHQPHT